MATNDLYGCLVPTLEESKSLLEKILDITFEARDSLYHGEYYHYGNNAEEHFLLKNNVDPFDGEPAEINFADYPILLYVNRTTRSSELRNLFDRALGKFPLLRQKDA